MGRLAAASARPGAAAPAAIAGDCGVQFLADAVGEFKLQPGRQRAADRNLARTDSRGVGEEADTHEI